MNKFKQKIIDKLRKAQPWKWKKHCYYKYGHLMCWWENLKEKQEETGEIENGTIHGKSKRSS